MRFWLAPVSESHCSKCDLLIRERKRKPCSRCGSLARIINRTAEEKLGTVDTPR